jgi:hypothetical protein
MKAEKVKVIGATLIKVTCFNNQSPHLINIAF